LNEQKTFGVMDIFINVKSCNCIMWCIYIHSTFFAKICCLFLLIFFAKFIFFFLGQTFSCSCVCCLVLLDLRTFK
jgi:hypothetical protein